MIDIKAYDDLELGDKIEIYLNEDGFLSVKELSTQCYSINFLFREEDDLIYTCWVQNEIISFGAEYHNISGTRYSLISGSDKYKEYLKSINENWQSDVRFFAFSIPNLKIKDLIKNKKTKNLNNQKVLSCINPLCKESNPWAESNLPNNFFMCFSCRDTKKWAFNLLTDNLQNIEDKDSYIKSLFIKV